MTEWQAGSDDGPNGGTLVGERQYDWMTTAPIEGIVQTISEVTGRSFETLPPLEHTVSTDAISMLLAAPGRTGPADGTGVTFRYEGLIVTAYSTGRVALFRA